MASTAADWRRQTSATSRQKPVAIAGTCGNQKPTTAATTVSTIRLHRRLNRMVPGSSSGSAFVLRADASSSAMPGVGASRRPIQSPASVARHHQIAAT